MAEEKNFEESMDRLEQIVSTLEKGDASLEQALNLFEEGTKLAKSCAKQLDNAEQKVVKLTKGPDGAPIEHPFEEESEE